MTDRRNSVVHAWLSDIPNNLVDTVFADLRSEQERTAAQRDDTVTNVKKPGKRRALRAVDGNAIMPPKKTKHTKGAGGKEEVLDAEATPRATRAGVLSPSRSSQEQPLTHSGFDGSNDDPSKEYLYGDQLFGRPLPALQSRKSESSKATSSMGESAIPSSRSRARSPVKTTVELAMAEKPIYFHMVDDAAGIPADVLELFKELNGVQAGHGALPSEIETQVRAASKGIPELYPYNFAERLSSSADSRSKFEARLEIEMETLLDIISSTNNFISTPPSETTWNEDVHSQILKLALNHHHSTPTPTGSSEYRNIKCHNVTFARPLLQLVPRNISGLFYQAKMVDYAMTISDPAISARIKACLKHQDPPLSKTINHTDYTPLLYDPIAVSIETKAPGGAVPHPQLAVWAATHFARLRVLLNLSPTEDYGGTMITLPLLAVEGSRWDVLFAVDKGESVELMRVPGVIGDTSTLLGCYKALALLRCLARWIQEVFKPWFAQNILATVET